MTTFTVFGLPLMIPVIATGYIVTIYGILLLLERMREYKRP
ncbi:MAG: hypothetical protein WA902_02535 [Thermosynechococcaceae cyanobacterium]